MRGWTAGCIALFLVLVAGCSDPAKPAHAETQTSVSGADAMTEGDPFAGPPTWQRGQWWTYEVTSSDGSAAEPDTRVVTDVVDGGYVVDTVSRAAAAFDAEEDISYVGPIDASDLSGLQNGERVVYFHFPMRTDESWTTRWDGVERTIHALGPSKGAFQFEATENGTVAVRYSYDPAARWFGSIEFLDANGTVDYGLRLTSHGEHFQGTIVRATVLRIFTENAGGPGTTAARTFELPSGLDELLIRYECACTQGNWAIDVESFNAAVLASGGLREHGVCPSDLDEEFVQPEPFSGTWRYVGVWNFPDGSRYAVEALARIYAETQIES